MTGSERTSGPHECDAGWYASLIETAEVPNMTYDLRIGMVRVVRSLVS